MQSSFVHHAAVGRFETVAPGIHVRDLGLAAATDGAWQLQVVHLEPVGARVEALHRHDEGHSLAYVLDGWLDVEFAQLGLQHLGPETVIPAFNGPLHRERDCGGDFQLLLLVTARAMRDDPRQHVVVQQVADAPVHDDARTGEQVRDFALEELTGGRMRGRARRARPGSMNTPRRHGDAARLSLCYVAAGWLDIAFEDAEPTRLAAGSLAAAAPGEAFAEFARSADAQVIELEVPV